MLSFISNNQNSIENKQNNDDQGVMTGIHKQHHWSFFSQVENEDVSQEAEKDLLGNPFIGFCCCCFFFFLLEEGDFKPFQRIEARVPGVGEDQQWWNMLP